MGTAHADEAVWNEAEARIRAEIHRLDEVVSDLRTGTAHLHWRGPAARRFGQRTDRRVRDLHNQRAMLTLLLSLIRRAGSDAHAQAAHAQVVSAKATHAQATNGQAHGQGKAKQPC